MKPNATCRNAIRRTSSRAMSLDARRTGPIAAVGLDMVPRAHRVQKNTPVHVKNPPCRASGSEAGRQKLLHISQTTYFQNAGYY